MHGWLRKSSLPNLYWLEVMIASSSRSNGSVGHSVSSSSGTGSAISKGC